MAQSLGGDGLEDQNLEDLDSYVFFDSKIDVL